jgi:phosphatidylglycerophosphatase A
LKNLATKCATCFGVGYAPFAPGSFGSLIGLVLGVFLHYLLSSITTTHGYYAAIGAVTLILAILTYVSYVIIEKAEQEMNAHDPKSIVLDEVIGQAIVTSFFPSTYIYITASYILFRFFDILKPWPVGHIDKNWGHAKGTLFDDVAAGIMALICLTFIHHYFL